MMCSEKEIEVIAHAAYSAGYKHALDEFTNRVKELCCHYSETEHTFDFDGVTIEDIEQLIIELKNTVH